MKLVHTTLRIRPWSSSTQHNTCLEFLVLGKVVLESMSWAISSWVRSLLFITNRCQQRLKKLEPRNIISAAVMEVISKLSGLRNNGRSYIKEITAYKHYISILHEKKGIQFFLPIYLELHKILTSSSEVFWPASTVPLWFLFVLSVFASALLIISTREFQPTDHLRNYQLVCSNFRSTSSNSM